MIEILVYTVASILAIIFCYGFLIKYHTRHIGPGPQAVHRNLNNERRKRREVIIKKENTFFGFEPGHRHSIVKITANGDTIQEFNSYTWKTED